MALLTNVLLVDDDKTTNFLHRSLLSRLGVAERIDVVHDGQQALDLLLAPDPAALVPVLILLDLHMSGLNGIEFLQAYQQLSPAQYANTVVVVVTSSVHPRDMTRLTQLPVDAVITKPLNREKLNELLRSHFQCELPPVADK